MAEPISEQIVSRLVTTLQGITRTAGYPVTAIVKRFDERGNATGDANADVVIEVEANAPMWKPEIAPLTRDGYEMAINVLCTVKSPEDTTTPMDVLLHRVYASVYKAWCADYSMNSLAINSSLGKVTELMKGTVPYPVIPLTVWFYTDGGDPFNQTN